MTFEELKGQTLTKVVVGQDSVKFVVEGEGMATLMHHQDCCESVGLEEVVGDVSDLVGHEILEAYMETNCEEPPAVQPDIPDYIPDSYTWTFYRLVTAEGPVTFRFYGESNGYYSEDVAFVWTPWK